MATVYDEQDQQQGADIFDTPEIKVPPSPPDAHRAQVTSVTSKHLNNDKQTGVVSVNLTSRDVATLETSLDIFIPRGFEESLGSGVPFDPRALPEEDGNKQQTSYRLGIANSDKTATVQKLVILAKRAGKDPAALGLSKPTSLEEYSSNLNAMLQGLEVIMLRRERGGDDPAFAHQLQVRDITAADEAENNPKRFKKYKKAWESE